MIFYLRPSLCQYFIFRCGCCFAADFFAKMCSKYPSPILMFPILNSVDFFRKKFNFVFTTGRGLILGALQGSKDFQWFWMSRTQSVLNKFFVMNAVFLAIFATKCAQSTPFPRFSNRILILSFFFEKNIIFCAVLVESLFQISNRVISLFGDFGCGTLDLFIFNFSS